MTSRTFTSSRLPASAVAVLAAAVLALSACNTGGNPGGGESATPTTSASVTPSATPPPTATYKPADAKGKAENVPVPVLPEAAKAETKAGLVAFSKHWYALLNYAYQTGDFAPLDDVTASTCALCGKVRPGILEWTSEGRWIAGGLVKATGAFTEFVKTSSGTYQVTTQLEQSAGTLHRADASVEKTVPASQVLADIMSISFVEGRWKAINVDRLVA